MASQVRRTLHGRGVSWRNPGVAAAAVAAGALIISGCAAPYEAPSTMTEEVPPPPVWTGEPEPVDFHEDEDEHGDESSSPGRTLEAQLALADGTEIGLVTFSETEDFLRIRAVIQADPDDLSPGFKGFHIHEVGACEAEDGEDAFTSAGGHLDLEGATHEGTGASGDLVSIQILENGRAELVTLTDRVTVDDLLIGDGTSVIVHEGPDNFANIPDRYEHAEGDDVPDEQTLATGDAGARAACGVIEVSS
ncbi:superoxide dismutase family protein [Hoyosella subflava]|uniref:superoxide dismutase family protein n=1 Tax=Hoyosella subflava TaxID=639313 RepID=UPI000A000F4C|nr:superoxide dismutase family protein [Hoyosella subflava]